MNQSEQAWHDLHNPAFQQRTELYWTDAEYEEFYAPKPLAPPRDDNAGISPSKVAVAKALLEPVLRGWISWRGASLQERKDAVWSMAKSKGIPFAGSWPEEWLDEFYIAEVDEMLTALIEHAALWILFEYPPSTPRKSAFLTQPWTGTAM
jgi:hypothetical protein